MLVGLLAVLKAGAAYAPQHVGRRPRVAAAPRHRRRLDARDPDAVEPAPSRARPRGHVCIEIDAVARTEIASFAPPRRSRPDRGCFVLFTSGTTGKPNGVTITHRNVCNILLSQPGDLGMAPGMRVAQILSIAFDMSAWESSAACRTARRS